MIAFVDYTEVLILRSIFIPRPTNNQRGQAFPLRDKVVLLRFIAAVRLVQMRKTWLHIVILALLLPACSPRAGGRTTVVVKPKYHHWWFNKKKDRHKKRTKLVRMRN